MSTALQLGNPKGRVDLLFVRLLECEIKRRMNISARDALYLDLMRVGETVCKRLGVSCWDAIRPELEQAARDLGVRTQQTLPEVAASLGFLRVAKQRRAAKCM